MTGEMRAGPSRPCPRPTGWRLVRKAWILSATSSQ
jgi:hypothetical protein